MKNERGISRRQAILSLATLAGGTLIRPGKIFSVEPVKRKIRFAVIGDWGTGGDDQYGVGRQMASAHQRTAFDFILTAGDNIYPNGSGRYFERKFEQPFQGLVRDRVKFYAALGNHDVRDGREDQTQYPLFNMRGRNYYSFTQGEGLVEFFMLDSTDYDYAQAGWLEQSLRASKAKWKIAVFHHPIYSSGKRHGSDLRLRTKLEPLFTKYRVDVVFSGHDHFYERTKPQQGVQYFVTGSGGKTRRGAVDLKSPFTAKSFDRDNHFMLIELDERQLSFQAVSETGSLIDSGSFGSAHSPRS